MKKIILILFLLIASYSYGQTIIPNSGSNGKGVKGDTGERGLKGDSGYTPRKGIDYSDGTNGTNGINGVNADTSLFLRKTNYITIDTSLFARKTQIQAIDTSLFLKKTNYVTVDTSLFARKTQIPDTTSLSNRINTKTNNYTINVQALTSSPTDGQTVYFGNLPRAPTTTANTSKIYIRKAGSIKIAEIYCYSGTAGTNENWSLYIRLNNTTDYLINTLGVNTSERVFTNVSLNITVAVGDYIEIKGIQPTWVTNPLTTIYGGYIYFE